VRYATCGEPSEARSFSLTAALFLETAVGGTLGKDPNDLTQSLDQNRFVCSRFVALRDRQLAAGVALSPLLNHVA
jgi:hypothetical protein